MGYAFRHVQPVTLLIPSLLRKRTKLGANKLATLSCRGPEDFRLPVGWGEYTVLAFKKYSDPVTRGNA